MRSGTSFFDWTVFKKTVLRFWPLWGAYFALWLVALPLNGLMVLRMDNSGYSYGYGNTMQYFSFNRVPQTVENDGLTIFVVFGVLAAMAVFSHLFNARSANLFGSLPIRREGLFLTHYLAGLTFFIVPNVVIFLLTLLVEAAGGCLVMKGLLFWLAVACGEGFFFYSLAVFCAMFTGHILALPAFYAIVNFLVLIVTQLVEVVFNAFYYGFAGFPHWVETVTKWFTPTVQLQEAVSCWTHESYYNDAVAGISDQRNVELKIEGLGTVGVYVVVALLLAVCAFLLYRVRRLESAGDVVSVKAMRPVFKYGVALCSGLALGMGTMMIMLGGGEVPLMVAMVVWSVVGYFAAEMLLQKSFKVFKQWKGAVVVAAVFIAMFLVVGFDLTGYETRVPGPDSVESVEVSGLDIMYLWDDGNGLRDELTDPELIKLIVLLHEKAVEQRDTDWEDWFGQGASSSLYVTYHLKNGGTLSRSYHTLWLRPDETEQEGTAAWAAQRLYNNRELCWRMYGFDELEEYLAKGGRLAEAEHSTYDDYYGNVADAVFYGNDAEALLAAVKEDFFAGRVGARRVVKDSRETYSSENYEFLEFRSDIGDDDRYYSVRIALSDTATSTLAALEEMADRAVRPGGPRSEPYTDDVIGLQPVYRIS